MSVSKFMGSVIAGDATWQLLSDDCNEVPAPKTSWSSQATGTDPRRGSYPSEPSEKAVEATMSKQRGKKVRQERLLEVTVPWRGQRHAALCGPVCQRLIPFNSARASTAG